MISRLPFCRLAGRFPAFMDSETQKTESVYDFLAWFEVNKKRVAIGGAVFLVLAGAIATAIWYNEQKEIRASEALSAVRVPMNPNEAAAPDTVKKLEEVVAEYPGTKAAARAELIRAGLLYTEGQYAEAQAAFERFQRDHSESPWFANAFYGVAACLDAQSKTNEAIAKYEDFIRRYPNHVSVDQARLHVATLLEGIGKPAQALEQYEKITKSVVFSPAMSEARQRQQQLLEKYPELVQTNKPVISPVVPSLTQTSVVTAIKTNLAPATNRPAVSTTNPPAAAPTNAPATQPAATNAPAAADTR